MKNKRRGLREAKAEMLAKKRRLKRRKRIVFLLIEIFLLLILLGEVAEAYDAWKKKKDDLNEELADVAIYLMGLSEMLGFDLADEIEKKVSKNEKRVYKNIDGVNIRISD